MFHISEADLIFGASGGGGGGGGAERPVGDDRGLGAGSGLAVPGKRGGEGEGDPHGGAGVGRRVGVPHPEKEFC